MILTRKWAMPNRWTFKIKPIKKLIDKYCTFPHEWVDPFAGKFSRAYVTNDLNPEYENGHCMDALEFLKIWHKERFQGAFYDPPYSMRQAKECYKSFGEKQKEISVTSMKYWASVKTLLARIIKPGGICICCGWSSMGLGKTRGYEMIEVLLVPHGGSRNDTIVTVERKIK